MVGRFQRLLHVFVHEQLVRVLGRQSPLAQGDCIDFLVVFTPEVGTVHCTHLGGNNNVKSNTFVSIFYLDFCSITTDFPAHF